MRDASIERHEEESRGAFPLWPWSMHKKRKDDLPFFLWEKGRKGRGGNSCFSALFI